MKCERSGVGELMVRRVNGWGIQSFGSSWAKKMIVLRTEIRTVVLQFVHVSSIFD